jgi:hypothetical protein
VVPASRSSSSFIRPFSPIRVTHSLQFPLPVLRSSPHHSSPPLRWPECAMARFLLAVLIASAAAAFIAAEKTDDILGPIALSNCDDTAGSYPAGSSYANNVADLISNLVASASVSPALFASGSTGAGEGAAYRVVVCRGDISSEDCFDCGSRAVQDVPVAFNRSRDAAVLSPAEPGIIYRGGRIRTIDIPKRKSKAKNYV